MKIISGKHKGRIIKTAPSESGYRPTTSRTREAVLSIITSGKFSDDSGKTLLDGALVVDICCGSGPMGLEFLSRGAKHLIAIDIEQARLEVFKENAISYGELGNVSIMRADAGALPKARNPCDIIFMDPPYSDKHIASQALISLVKQGWLKPSSVIILELEKYVKLEVPEQLEIDSERIHGKTKLVVLNSKQYIS